MKKNTSNQAGTQAIYTALFAFISWGLLPAYWKTMQAVPALSILCHRMIWSCIFVALILWIQKRWKEVRDILDSGKKLLVLLTSGLVVGANWFLYIWAVNNGYVLETSLGYYINPLCNILLGCLFFKDRLRTAQTLSIFCAVFGVGYMLLAYGRLPWIALALAFSFSSYGLIRKIVDLEKVDFKRDNFLKQAVQAWQFLHQKRIFSSFFCIEAR